MIVCRNLQPFKSGGLSNVTLDAISGSGHEKNSKIYHAFEKSVTFKV